MTQLSTRTFKFEACITNLIIKGCNYPSLQHKNRSFHLCSRHRTCCWRCSSRDTRSGIPSETRLESKQRTWILRWFLFHLKPNKHYLVKYISWKSQSMLILDFINMFALAFSKCNSTQPLKQCNMLIDWWIFVPQLRVKLQFRRRASSSPFPSRQSCNARTRIPAKPRPAPADRRTKTLNSNSSCRAEHFSRLSGNGCWSFGRSSFRQSPTRTNLTTWIRCSPPRRWESWGERCRCRPCQRCSRGVVQLTKRNIRLRIPVMKWHFVKILKWPLFKMH